MNVKIQILSIMLTIQLHMPVDEINEQLDIAELQSLDFR